MALASSQADTLLFQQNSDVFSAVSVSNISRMQLIDIDSDSDLDLIYNSGGIFLLTNFGTNEAPLFDSNATNITKYFSAAGIGNGQVILGDLDSDGDPDALVRLHIYGHTNKTFWSENFNASNLAFVYKRDLILDGPNLSLASSVNLIDYDSDNDLDLVYYQDHNLRWQENISDTGSFPSFKQRENTYINGLGTPFFSDINNDGSLEM
ncbi:hypothetical protein N9U74_02655, partial [Synechococcus sp. AH-736-M02]|nr:hypothetical protein [Synechococcus sp. AH-736-M02]